MTTGSPARHRCRRAAGVPVLRLVRAKLDELWQAAQHKHDY